MVEELEAQGGNSLENCSTLAQKKARLHFCNRALGCLKIRVRNKGVRVRRRKPEKGSE